MKKKLIAIIAMACVAAFVLSACGGGGNTPSGSGAAAPRSWRRNHWPPRRI